VRQPNPPKVLLGGLSIDQQRKLIRLALEVVHDLALENDWAAFERVEFAKLELEERLAFGSLLNSKQGATMASIASAAYDKRAYK